MKKPSFSQAGDTIVEVLISVATLSLVLVVAYVSTSRSLENGIDSSDRQQAVGLASQQIEIVKNAAATNQTALSTYESGPGTPFCIDATALGNAQYGKSGVNTASCQDINGGIINLSDTADSTGLFTIKATWPSTVSGSSGKSQLTLYYR